MSIIRNFSRTDRKCLRKFMYNMVFRGLTGFIKFRKRRKRGEMFPAFQFISVTNDCNLKCQGCWVTTDGKGEYMAPEKIKAVIDAGKKHGSYFYGILGGEPLMYKHLASIFNNNPDCYFQLFTNGTLFTSETAAKLKEAGNVTPLISLEGDELVADIRRGGHNIYNRTLAAVKTSVDAGLITGMAISVCKSKIEMALSDEFVNKLHDMGVLYIWYYIYRPVGENPSYELALDIAEITRLRRFLVEGRNSFPMILIDSYWRANGEPFCPAADGLSHHINASGYIEPCPIIQYAAENISEDDVNTVYDKSAFLRDFRQGINEKTKGCIVMEEASWLNPLAEKHKALNSSNRQGYKEELLNAPATISHGSCPVIPEKNFIYRMAKKTAFFGMGAYG